MFSLKAMPAMFAMVSPDYWELLWVASEVDSVVDIDDVCIMKGNHNILSDN